MTVTVVNKLREPNHVYCGRGTPLGNPFVMVNEDMRDEVCDKYEIWFQQQIDIENESVMNQLGTIIELAKLGNVNLGCYCAPRRCHCDTIKEYVDEQVQYCTNKSVYNIIVAGGREFSDWELLSDVMTAATSVTIKYFRERHGGQTHLELSGQMRMAY